ncbi:hypothetical protein FB451DRAFT_1176108 [Mycena latifolia]|nr:hypothetical protein FB451DRAFT_1176108 [Mycena latifolia]
MPISALPPPRFPHNGAHSPRRLPDVPYDCMFEVYSSLTPLDLLQLARTSRPMRQDLFDLSSRRLWKMALSRVNGLPPCPPGISEPAYANLAFSLHCHECVAPCTRDICADWDLRVRLCPPCSRKLLLTFDEERLPYFVSNKLVKIRDLVAVRPPTPFGCAVLKMAFLEARRQFERIPEANQDAYTAAHRNARVLARTHARECRVWESRIIEKLKADRSEAFAFHSSQCKPHLIHLLRMWTKLYVLQWGAELKVVTRYKFDRLPLVDRAEELTDAVWAEIGPELERYLLRVREEKAGLKEQNLLILARRGIKGTRSKQSRKHRSSPKN